VNSEDTAMLSFPQLEVLGEAGPAQTDLLIHFCGRPFGRQSTPSVPDVVRSMSPETRLYSILWQQQLRGFAPFGADDPMICFSESPPEHLSWLLRRGWQPWGLVFARQSLYQVGGGPAWYVRSPQYDELSPAHRAWAVRLDANPSRRSDWLHEREWRVPHPWIHLPAGSVVAVITGHPDWQPWGVVQREILIDPTTGGEVDPSFHNAVPQLVASTELPPLWATVQKWHWDIGTGRVMQRPV
jgi:hypothetical protein